MSNSFCSCAMRINGFKNFNKKGERCKAGLDWSKAIIQAIEQSKTGTLIEKITDNFIEDALRGVVFVSRSSSGREAFASRS